jgi:predicted ATPase
MLKKLILENWKSFRYAELPIDPLTILIGTNASGKSNAVEALEFLSRIVRGMTVEEALLGDSNTAGIRGGLLWATLKHESAFTIKALTQGDEEDKDYLYSITVNTKAFYIITESLIRIEKPSELSGEEKQIKLFQTNHSGVQVNSLGMAGLPHSFGAESDLVALDNEIFTSPVTPVLSYIPFSSPSNEDSWKEFRKEYNTALKALYNVYTFSPVSSTMRGYSAISSSLLPDASNLAGVLASLSDEEKARVESTISEYVTHLPERDIQKVWAEPIGRLGSDAMLYCEESWIAGESMVVDARGMSDGTLRFIAILTALLTRPEGSQLVIEEVDNGLHPSRADLLLKMLREIGSKRNIDILVTTHNPALLDALEPEMIPFVVVAHRDSKTGESKLTPLDDIQNLPKLLASGSLGNLAERGAIEKSLSDSK